MAHAKITIEGMSCEHCVAAVTGAIAALPGTSGIAVDLAGGSAEFDYDPAQASVGEAVGAIEDQGFDAAEA
ncbi:MAG: cation transporter [Clostridiales Family XIII bacterium]|jgi:copper chaperone|nr:cation transporter [Clostridiales Family XIII bacterium]